MNAALHDDGFLPAGSVLTTAELERARAATDRLLAIHGASSDYGVIALDAWRREPVFRGLLDPVARLARDLLGLAAVRLFQDLVIDKPASATTPLPLHQDQAYLPLDRDDGVVAWIALDDADAASGCLHYVPGSHRLGRRRPASFSGAPECDLHLPAIDPGDRPVVPVPVSAGDALFHLPQVWHGSPPNVSRSRRRAWSIWFVHPDVRWAPDRASHPYLTELAPAPGPPLTGERFPCF